LLGLLADPEDGCGMSSEMPGFFWTIQQYNSENCTSHSRYHENIMAQSQRNGVIRRQFHGKHISMAKRYWHNNWRCSVFRAVHTQAMRQGPAVGLAIRVACVEVDSNLHRSPESCRRWQEGNPLPRGITGPPCSWAI
jgi:hypothetical protein